MLRLDYLKVKVDLYQPFQIKDILKLGLYYRFFLITQHHLSLNLLKQESYLLFLYQIIKALSIPNKFPFSSLIALDIAKDFSFVVLGTITSEKLVEISLLFLSFKKCSLSDIFISFVKPVEE